MSDESTLAGFFLIATGLYVFIKYTVQYRAGKKQRRWPKVMGKITRSEVILGSDLSVDMSPSQFKVKKDDMYTDCIEYEYKVAGKLFKGNRVRALESASNVKSWETRYVKKYSVGKTVQLLYDAVNPSDSLLETAILSSKVYSLILFFSFLSTGVGIYLARSSFLNVHF